MDDKSRENAKEIRVGIASLEDVVSTLNSLGKISPDVFFIEFMGVKMYSSDELSIDDAYKKVYGYTKSECSRNAEAAMAIRRKTVEIGKEQAKSMIGSRFEEGIKYIYPERSEMWKKYLEDHAEKGISGEDSVRFPELLIECLKRLENGESFESVFGFVKNFSQMDYTREVTSALLKFSKVGPEYCEYVSKTEPGLKLSESSLRRLEEIKRENYELAKVHESKREVSISEVGEVARGETRISEDRALNAVIGSEGNIQEGQGQAHADE